jgi:hypothetical protein
MYPAPLIPRTCAGVMNAPRFESHALLKSRIVLGGKATAPSRSRLGPEPRASASGTGLTFGGWGSDCNSEY